MPRGLEEAFMSPGGEEAPSVSRSSQCFDFGIIISENLEKREKHRE